MNNDDVLETISSTSIFLKGDKIMDDVLVVKSIASSFVSSDMKISTDRGAGEAKLFVGSMSNNERYDNFFEFNKEFRYKFDKENLKVYLNQIKLEYAYQKINKYKNVSIDHWNNNYEKIANLEDDELFVSLEKFNDESRYYVRANDDVFKKLLRGMVIPKLTDIVFEKDTINKIILIKLQLNLEIDMEKNKDIVEIENYTEDELSEILKEFYNNPQYTKNAGIQLFGIKYGPLIELKKYNKAEIIKKAGLNESYGVELYKGIALSNYVEMKNCDDVEYIISDEKSNIAGENFNTGYISKYSRNRIIFGAPGTGKSYRLNKDREELLKDGNEKNYERVTFHPDYSYANFVGTYKPIPYKKEDGEEGITYEYVPGPFMRIYVEALKNSRTDNIKPYLLIIEEINRANVAAVFGDVFQLLDRDENNVSEYPIEASEDMKKYLAKELGGAPNNYKKIYIPDNMFIWATMNSADQGVFPMDTAFKRRWEFSYLGIDEKEEGIENRYIILGNGEFKRKVEWNKLRKAINNKLSSLKVNEDKLLGPYFLSSKAISVNKKGEIDKAVFVPIFKGKVLMYLFEDAAKQRRKALFALDDDNIRYSSICKEFDEKGVYVFDSDISKEFDKDIIEEEN